MRAILALSVLAAVAASGCASRDTMRALQAPQAAPLGAIEFENEHEYRDAVVIDWIGGVSQWSYVFAEPNQRVMRPILQEALNESGLGAGTNVRARYGLRVDVSEANGPEVGADYDSQLVATYVLTDRAEGREVWRREIATPGVGHFLLFNESDWQTAWFIDPILAVYNVANPYNYFAFASNSAADNARDRGAAAQREARQRVVGGSHDSAMVERFGPQRAARANYAAVRTNVSAFLVAFAADNDVEMIPILPCWGTPEQEARKAEIMAAGGRFRTDDCSIGR
jgi:hypothetical protein